jgi:hypothetical protein
LASEIGKNRAFWGVFEGFYDSKSRQKTECCVDKKRLIGKERVSFLLKKRIGERREADFSGGLKRERSYGMRLPLPQPPDHRAPSGGNSMQMGPGFFEGREPV